MKNEVEVNIQCNSDETIEKLEKIKALLTDIHELDNNFSLSNVIEVDKRTILLFSIDTALIKDKEIEAIRTDLQNKLQIDCVLLINKVKFEKALHFTFPEKHKYIDDEIGTRKDLEWRGHPHID